MDSIEKPEDLFQFELAPVENIEPWGTIGDGSLSLSLYALTEGHFRMSVGKEVLLRYTPEIISHWELPDHDADYIVAGFTRDVLALASAAASRIPSFFENIVRDRSLFNHLRKYGRNDASKVPSSVIGELEGKKSNSNFNEEHYNAFRWLGERALWLNYLTACPDIWFVRMGDELWIQWDNIDRKVDGIEVWTTRSGTYVLSVQGFLRECRSFSERLLSAMESRIVRIENGLDHPKIPLDVVSLRQQLSEFKNEFEGFLSASYEPDLDWEESERAIRNIALKSGVNLPTR